MYVRVCQAHGNCFVIVFLQVLGFIRDSFGRRNLAKKTLVDDRFLI